MGRVVNPLTGTQKDEATFSELVKTIKKIGAYKLASYGLISHERIYHYIRRTPVGTETEQAILDSIKEHNKALKKVDEASVAATKEVLAQTLETDLQDA